MNALANTQSMDANINNASMRIMNATSPIRSVFFACKESNSPLSWMLFAVVEAS